MVSVVIPFYNSSKYVKDALESILFQEVAGIEVVVVDDGSTVEESWKCKEIIKSFPELTIKYYQKSNEGAASARNFGVKHCSHNYLAFLDSDDVWLKGKLISQLKLIKNEKYDVVIGNVIVADYELVERYKSKKILPSETKEIIKAIFMGKISMNTPTILMKKNLFNLVGGFSEDLKYREDHFFLMDCVSQGRLGLDGSFLTVRREREGSLSTVGDLYDELAKHEPFWILSSRKFPFLNIHSARTKLVVMLGLFYLKRNDTQKVDQCVAFLANESSGFMVLLLAAKRLNIITQLIFKLRDTNRNA